MPAVVRQVMPRLVVAVRTVVVGVGEVVAEVPVRGVAPGVVIAVFVWMVMIDVAMPRGGPIIPTAVPLGLIPITEMPHSGQPVFGGVVLAQRGLAAVRARLLHLNRPGVVMVVPLVDVSVVAVVVAVLRVHPATHAGPTSLRWIGRRPDDRKHRDHQHSCGH